MKKFFMIVSVLCFYLFSKGNNSVVICDTTTILIYKHNIKDTLIGKSMVIISLENNQCENRIMVKGVHVDYLSLVIKSSPFSRLFNYKYLITKLSKEEKITLDFYEKELLKILKVREICCLGRDLELEYNRYTFVIPFLVIPIE